MDQADISWLIAASRVTTRSESGTGSRCCDSLLREAKEDKGNERKMTTKTKRGKIRRHEELRKHNEHDEGRKKRRTLKWTEKRSRSKEEGGERETKKRKNLKAESMSVESISYPDL